MPENLIISLFNKLCECGCGQAVKPGNRFVCGHNGKGKNFSKEHKRRLSLSHKKNPVRWWLGKNLSQTLK